MESKPANFLMFHAGDVLRRRAYSTLREEGEQLVTKATSMFFVIDTLDEFMCIVKRQASILTKVPILVSDVCNFR